MVSFYRTSSRQREKLGNYFYSWAAISIVISLGNYFYSYFYGQLLLYFWK